jgi:PIN domain nuclease of toxin-antitoxin system
MRLLLDTHVLIWAFAEPGKLSMVARELLEDERNELFFSVISLWEIGVKRDLKREDFSFDPHLLRGSALAAGYTELALQGEHVLAVDQLPALHGDPYDRLLICQALMEGLTLLTKDRRLLEYPASVRRV